MVDNFSNTNSGVSCKDKSCPRNESGICELSRLDKIHDWYREPLSCSHYKFKFKGLDKALEGSDVK
jgi:hypothetical protein